MAEENTAQFGRLVTIAQVAAENIARVLDLPEAAVAPLQEAIGDEIAAMSAHFAFTINDLREQWEKAEGKLTEVRRILDVELPSDDGQLDAIRDVLDFEPTPQMGSIELTEIPANG
jgi:hypothetical protein